MKTITFFDLKNECDNDCKICDECHCHIWGSMTSHAVLAEGWRDVRKEAPTKTGVYATYTYPTEYDGEIYSFELYSEKHGGWCESEHTIDLWCNLPDLPL